MDIFPKNHDVGPHREDSKVRTSQTRSSSCQCTTTLCGMQKEMMNYGKQKRCEYNSQTVANYARHPKISGLRGNLQHLITSKR